jgi:hypothetical protein
MSSLQVHSERSYREEIARQEAEQETAEDQESAENECDDDPCCEECWAWRTGEHDMQDAINAAYERLKAASVSYSLQQGVFVIGKDEE